MTSTLSSRFSCRNEYRLRILKESTLAGTPNAIEYIEVRHTDEPDPAMRQRTLYVRTIHPVPAPGSANELHAANVVIEGGERVAEVPVEWVARADATGAAIPPGVTPAAWTELVKDLDEPDHVLVVRTTVRGDFSTYALSLVTAGSTVTVSGFDPELSSVTLRFKIECPTDFDCLPPDPCLDILDHTGPRIDYLAKDYTGFRRIMLERLSELSPSWSERNAADIGIAIVELLAYAADELSWRQDAIATEAYLGTARSRISLRRHARLVDYRVHEGCSARAFLRVETNAATANLPAHTVLFTNVPGVADTVLPNSPELTRALQLRPEVFETCLPAVLHKNCNHIELYGWGDPAACLPKDATSATLHDHPDLHPGDVLVLAETADPSTGATADADRSHRYAVRLTEVVPDQDDAGGLFASPQTLAPVDVTRITWHEDDALPAALPLVHPASGNSTAVAWGNIVLADHGFGIVVEDIDPDEPVLPPGPLAFVVAPPPASTSARATVGELDARAALPAIDLKGTRLGIDTDWYAQRDLLASFPVHPHFVVEVETDGIAHLRFGDGRHGMAPEDGTTFRASRRVGSPMAGNVGPESIRHVVTADPAIVRVSNPRAAEGGTDPETQEQVRRDAPAAFSVQERAVTQDDYAEMAQRSGTVQRAAATFRWTGSWNTVFVTADRPGGAKVDAAFEADLRGWLERFRMAGYDLEVDPPVFVPLEIDVLVCAAPQHLRSDIAAAAHEALSTQVNSDGSLGLFHPDQLTFGRPVYLSSVYAALHAIEGVESVSVTKFQRLGQPATSALDEGVLPMQRLEIARLDNDPNFPDRGQLTIRPGGGR